MRQALSRLIKPEYLGLCLLVLMSLILHFTIIEQPADLAFDEQHYVKDARQIIANHATERPEHPPLGKLIISTGIRLFGDNQFGWRFLPIIFGTISLILFYFICRRLGLTEEGSLIATFLLSLENLTFVQSVTVMLDVFFYAFMLAAFLLFLHGRWEFAAVMIGLSALAKLNGALALPAIFLYWLLTGRRKPVYFFASMMLAPLSFVLLMPLCSYIIEGQWLSPITQIQTMLSLSGSITFTGTTTDIASRPWEWVLTPALMWYWYTPHYIGTVSYTVWALIIPSFLYMILRAVFRHNASRFGISWFASVYLIWIPAVLITDRITYVYYMYPAVAAICIGIALGLSQLMDVWRGRVRGWRWVAIVSVAIYLIAHTAVFVILSPVFV